MQIKISQAEWVVMEVLWRQTEATANQVVEALSNESDWNEKTIRTLLNRLVKKKAVVFEKLNREYLYRPALSREHCVQEETHSFLERIGRAGLAPVLAAFLERHHLSEQELKELKAILDQKEAKS
ncbi:MAG: BlaI/MecI/CopY family transcriptional regulator [Sedimentisphaerales bacterium]|nr:BlaI/MecI/CopY family transcriptional regulator [Sedimentisphaerales bacterium]